MGRQKEESRMQKHFSFCILHSALFLLCLTLPLRAAFVYETTNEFFTTGFFNKDTNADVIVVDKVTGVARGGYQDANGNLTWSPPLVTGIENVSGMAAGIFISSSFDAIALTSPEF